MLKSLLPEGIPYYKANLHTHSTISDGTLTPEEVKKEYKQRGYSVLAMTDHSVMCDHHDLCDEDFLVINGVEMDIEDTEVPCKTRHLCLLCKDSHLLWVPYKDCGLLPHMLPYFEKCQCEGLPQIYTPEAINSVIEKANEKGFLVTYNHPTWSQESYPDYMSMQGLWAMEYRNTGSLLIGFDENNGRVYQDMLTVNEKLMPVMADDMHSIYKKNGACELGKAWIMVAAKELTLNCVMDALERGDLYASCGPEIHSIRSDADNIYVTCSPAASIQLISSTRAAVYREAKDGQLLEEATLPLKFAKKRCAGIPNSFIRLIVTAPDGTYAVTRAYTFDEL